MDGDFRNISKEALETIADSIPAGVVVIEKVNGKITYVNEKAISLYGVDPRGLQLPEHSTKLMKILTLIGDVYPPEQLPASKALLTGKDAKDELIIERPDGSRVIVVASAKAIRDEKGQIVAAVGIFDDITESKKAEKDLRRAKEQYELIFNSITEGFSHYKAVRDKNGMLNDILVIDINPSGASLSGVRREDQIGKTWRQLFVGVPEAAFDIYRQIDRSGEPLQIEYFSPITNRWYANYISKITKDEFVASFFDITQRKEAEEALKESEERFKMAQQVAHVGTFEWNIQTGVNKWSSELEAMYGLPSGGFSGTQDAWEQLVYPADRQEAIRKVSQAKERGSFEAEFRVLWPDNSIHWMLGRGWVFKDTAGKPFRLIGINIDITERKKAEEELNQHRVHLEKLVEERTKQLKDSERLAAIGATAGMVGHDIRNPLQAIVSDVYLAKTDLAEIPDSEEKKSVIESLVGIEENVVYIDKIVQDLQDFARPLTPISNNVNIEGICQEILLRNGIPKNIEISCQAEKNINFIADPDLIKRILTNLITNAIQAMPNGGKIVIRAQKEGKDSVLTVEDTGVGIPLEVRSKLFTPMVTTKSKGQGFGLAVVKRLTEALGGTVKFESEIGRGTKFILRFPSPLQRAKR